MKKRLRKKRRLGEFREECFELTFTLDPTLVPSEMEGLSDAFIDMIAEIICNLVVGFKNGPVSSKVRTEVQ